jgi:GT2 family glycosyltransferase
VPIHSITAVVLNWCAETDSARAIQSLLDHGGPGVTILLVDNASPDGSGPRLHARFPDIPYLQTGANLGYAGGNQRAIEWALARNADAVLIVNDDAELRPGCLDALRTAMDANPQLGACAPTIVHGPPHDDRVWWGGGDFNAQRACGVHRHAGERLADVQHQNERPSVPVTAVNGCVMLLRADAIRAVGGFNESYFCYNEDTELTLRLNTGGWHTAWIPQAVAIHHLPFPEAAPSPWAITQLDRNRRRLAHQHLGIMGRVRFMIWFYATRLAIIVLQTIKGDRLRLTAIWKGATAPLNEAP